MIRVLDIGAKYGYDCAQMFYPKDIVSVEYDSRKTMEENLDKIDLIIFGGGTDINPLLYGHKNVASHCAGNENQLSERDEFERELYWQALHSKIKMLGICRGAQFLCAITGGWLIQDCDGHTGAEHIVVTSHYGFLKMNSYHHQMMVPSPDSGWIGWSENNCTRQVYDVKGSDLGEGIVVGKEPEIIHFNNLCIGVQSHPEYVSLNNPQSKVVRTILNDYFKLGVTI